MTERNIRTASLSGDHGESIGSEPILSLVKIGQNEALAGFGSMPSLVSYKETMNLGADWRIRDMRATGRDAAGRHEPPVPYRDPMLAIGSMIQDHVSPLLGRIADKDVRSDRRPEDAVIFASIFLAEQRDAGSPVPGWTAVSGTVARPHGPSRSAWIVDPEGNVIDFEMGTFNRRRGRTGFLQASSREARAYRIERVLDRPRGRSLVCVLRGERDDPSGAVGRRDMRLLYDRLHLHACLYLDRCNHMRTPADIEIVV